MNVKRVVNVKIEKINEDKIQITLSVSDLEERNINLQSLAYNSPEAQELFWDMMHRAETELGFTTSDCQLFIEAASINSGKFVITITRVSENNELEKYIRSKIKRAELRVRKRAKISLSEPCIYAFERFEDICQLGNALAGENTGETTLYKYKTEYYIVFDKSIITLKHLETRLGEFAAKVKSPLVLKGILNEYGTKMIEGNALKILSKHFKK